MSISEIVLFTISSISAFSFLLMGCITLSHSPCIFCINKRRDCCVRKKKFIWQKEYRSEFLCKLSEVKQAVRIQRGLCLKLKSGKNIVLFESSDRRELLAFNKRVSEINYFLDNGDGEYEIKQSLFFERVTYLFYGCLLLFILFKMYSQF